ERGLGNREIDAVDRRQLAEGPPQPPGLQRQVHDAAASTQGLILNRNSAIFARGRPLLPREPMPARDPLEDLQLLIKSRYSIIVLETEEADRVEALLHALAARLRLPFFSWSPTKGLRRDGSASGLYGTTDPGQALANVEAAHLAALYYFEG